MQSSSLAEDAKTAALDHFVDSGIGFTKKSRLTVNWLVTKKGGKKSGVWKSGSENSPSRHLTHTRIIAPLNVIPDLSTLVFSGMQKQLE